jgi:hypothetical protein
MRLRTTATWFVCTVSKETPHNWDLAKAGAVWGIPTNGRKINMSQTQKGDYLLFYMASKGFFALAETTAPMKTPASKEEAPWAGGIYRYGAVIPMKILLELDVPMKKTFVDNKIEGTSIAANVLRRGFAQISNLDGVTSAEALILEKANQKKK